METDFVAYLAKKVKKRVQEAEEKRQANKQKFCAELEKFSHTHAFILVVEEYYTNNDSKNWTIPFLKIPIPAPYRSELDNYDFGDDWYVEWDSWCANLDGEPGQRKLIISYGDVPYDDPACEHAIPFFDRFKALHAGVRKRLDEQAKKVAAFCKEVFDDPATAPYLRYKATPEQTFFSYRIFPDSPHYKRAEELESSQCNLDKKTWVHVSQGFDNKIILEVIITRSETVEIGGREYTFTVNDRGIFTVTDVESETKTPESMFHKIEFDLVDGAIPKVFAPLLTKMQWCSHSTYVFKDDAIRGIIDSLYTTLLYSDD